MLRRLSGIAFLLALTVAPCAAIARVHVQLYDDSSHYIRSRTIINFNNSGQTVCFSTNISNRNIHVYYDVYPFFHSGKKLHAVADELLYKSQDAKIFGGLDSDGVRCAFLHSNYQ